MKKIYYPLLLSQLFCAYAFADDVSLGYCDGSMVGGSLSGANAVAIRLPASDFPMYQGSTITGVRIGLAADASKGVKIFIRSRVDGSDIYSFQTGSLYEGWSDIIFPKTLEYPASDVVVGYEVNTGVRPGVSAAGDYTSSGACMALEGMAWKDLTEGGTDPLCLQLLIDGGSYTKTDAALISATGRTVGLDTPFTLKGNIRNNTNRILSKVRLSVDMGEGTMEGDAQVADVLPGEVGEYSLEMKGMGRTGNYDAKLRIVSVDGKADEYAFNDEAKAEVRVIGEVVERKVLIEEFTSQGCVNCPTGKEILDKAVKGLDRVVMVAHHTGFSPDIFTVAGSTLLHCFYNSSTTFAPAVMFDRQPAPGNPGPVSQIDDYMRPRILARLDSPAEVALDLKRNYDASTRRLTVQVAVRQVEGMAVGANPSVSVYLLESGMVAFQSPNFNDYVHEHANRMFMTEVLGDPVELSSDDTTLATYSAKIDEAWNVDNMEVVAFVSNRDGDDPNNCGVYNAEKLPLVGSDKIDDSGVEGTVGEEAEIAAIYTLSGVRLDEPAEGVNIVRYTDGSVRKIVKSTK